jgi:putative ABC transport system permease protein
MRRKSRLIFLLSGLVIGISTVVSLVSITESMTSDIEVKLNRFGANIVMVPKTDTLSLSYGGIDVSGVNYELRELEEAKITEINKIKDSKNISIIAPKALGSVSLQDKAVLLMGVVFKEELALKTWWHVREGAFPEKWDELLLGAGIAEHLGIIAKDTIDLSGKVFKVAGVLNPTGTSEDDAVIMELSAAQQILKKEGKVSMVEISAFCQGCPINELTLQIAEKFPEAKVTAMKQAVASKMQAIEMFETFSMGICLMVILIGSLLVFVVMMGSVNERTREIGIFRAIGFRRGHVMQIILLEAMVLGIIGSILGFITGNLAALGLIPLVIKDGVFAGINFTLGATAILATIALCLIATLYPAFKASSLDPSEALRSL